MKWLLEKLTGKPRYYPEFEWCSNNWTYNVFRVYESLVGRRVGIKIEQIVEKDGTTYFFTLENLLATIEGRIRDYFTKNLAFKIVRVPELQLAGFRQSVGLAPYSFAIAFDTSVLTGSTPASWSHTVTGSNPGILGYLDNTTAGLTSCTYAAASLTGAISQQLWTSGPYIQIFYKGACSAGANTFASSADGYWGGSASYSGIQASSTVDSSAGSNNGSGGSSPLTISTTSVADNCWKMGFFQSADQTIAAGTSTTSRQTSDNFEFICDGNADITPAGSTSMQATWSGTNRVGGAIVTLAPFVETTTTSSSSSTTTSSSSSTSSTTTSSSSSTSSTTTTTSSTTSTTSSTTSTSSSTTSTSTSTTTTSTTSTTSSTTSTSTTTSTTTSTSSTTSTTSSTSSTTSTTSSTTSTSTSTSSSTSSTTTGFPYILPELEILPITPILEIKRNVPEMEVKRVVPEVEIKRTYKAHDA